MARRRDMLRWAADHAIARTTGRSLPGLWSAQDEASVGPQDADTVILGPTLMPGWMMPRFYRGLAERLGGDGDVAFHPMPERGGLGRTDDVVEHFRPMARAAVGRGRRLRIAGHSLGGLVVWALCHEFPEAIEVAEIWASPLRGTFVSHVRGPFAELRFLAPDSRWLRQYRDPVSGMFVRAVMTPFDVFASPALHTCAVRGDDVENHIVSPVPIPRALRPVNSYVHIAAAGHTLLPRRADVQAHLAAHDERTGRTFGRPELRLVEEI